MRIWIRPTVVLVIFAVVASLSPQTVHAYGGPGSIISGIGAFLAVVAAIGASIFGFVWYPAKKLYRRMTRDGQAAGSEVGRDAMSE